MLARMSVSRSNVHLWVSDLAEVLKRRGIAWPHRPGRLLGHAYFSRGFFFCEKKSGDRVIDGYSKCHSLVDLSTC